MSGRGEMLRLAAEVRARAHAPYSGFKVGACLRAEDGRLFAGCNVETIAYPEGLCAEAAAIGAMVAGGATRIAELLVLAEGEKLCTPCGGCRQKIAEFADPETPIHVAGPQGIRASFTLGELLPHGFDFERPGS